MFEPLFPIRMSNIARRHCHLRVAIQQLMLVLLIFYIFFGLNPRGAFLLGFEHHFALELARLSSAPFHNPVSTSADRGHGPCCL